MGRICCIWNYMVIEQMNRALPCRKITYPKRKTEKNFEQELNDITQSLKKQVTEMLNKQAAERRSLIEKRKNDGLLIVEEQIVGEIMTEQTELITILKDAINHKKMDRAANRQAPIP